MQLFVRGLIDGLDTPLGPVSIQAFVVPPVPGEFDGPLAYVWCDTGEETQMTMPRSYGLGMDAALENPTAKQVLHHCRISFMAQYDNSNPDTDPTVDQQFALMLDIIAKTLRGTNPTLPVPIPQQLTDPTTGETSWLVTIGVSMNYRQSPVIATEDQRILMLEGDIVTEIKEQVIG